LNEPHDLPIVDVGSVSVGRSDSLENRAR
jgi:hypothetical protein